MFFINSYEASAAVLAELVGSIDYCIMMRRSNKLTQCVHYVKDDTPCRVQFRTHLRDSRGMSKYTFAKHPRAVVPSSTSSFVVAFL
eukprot:677451-Prorocentrum_minimum.AAC.3